MRAERQHRVTDGGGEQGPNAGRERAKPRRGGKHEGHHQRHGGRGVAARPAGIRDGYDQADEEGGARFRENGLQYQRGEVRPGQYDGRRAGGGKRLPQEGEHDRDGRKVHVVRRAAQRHEDVKHAVDVRPVVLERQVVEGEEHPLVRALKEADVEGRQPRQRQQCR